MDNFKREERYIAVKLKALDDVDIFQLKSYLCENNIPTTECVIVESDWDIYEAVWNMVEASSE